MTLPSTSEQQHSMCLQQPFLTEYFLTLSFLPLTEYWIKGFFDGSFLSVAMFEHHSENSFDVRVSLPNVLTHLPSLNKPSEPLTSMLIISLFSCERMESLLSGNATNATKKTRYEKKNIFLFFPPLYRRAQRIIQQQTLVLVLLLSFLYLLLLLFHCIISSTVLNHYQRFIHSTISNKLLHNIIY